MSSAKTGKGLAHHLGSLIDGLGELEFAKMSDFNAGTVGAYWAAGGISPWERHPNDDEVLFVLEGEVEVTLMLDDGPASEIVSAGSVIVVPRGIWHKQRIVSPVRQFYVTPGETEHSDAEDPRQPANS